MKCSIWALFYKSLDLIKDYNLGPGQRFQFIFGVKGGVSDFNSIALQAFIKAVGNDQHWGVGGVGRLQYPAVVSAMLENGDVRIGFEDNIYIRKGVLAADNAEFVTRVVNTARDLNVRIASVEEAREKFNCVLQPA